MILINAFAADGHEISDCRASVGVKTLVFSAQAVKLLLCSSTKLCHETILPASTQPVCSNSMSSCQSFSDLSKLKTGKGVCLLGGGQHACWRGWDAHPSARSWDMLDRVAGERFGAASAAITAAFCLQSYLDGSPLNDQEKIAPSPVDLVFLPQSISQASPSCLFHTRTK